MHNKNIQFYNNSGLNKFMGIIGQRKIIMLYTEKKHKFETKTFLLKRPRA